MVNARLETIEPGKQYKVVFENLPTQAEGTFSEPLQVVTDSPELPTLPLTAHIKVRR